MNSKLQEYHLGANFEKDIFQEDPLIIDGKKFFSRLLVGTGKQKDLQETKNAIEESAYDYALQIEKAERVIVGVNKFELAEEEKYEPLKVDPKIEEQQKAKLEKLRKTRDNQAVAFALAELKAAAASNDNVLYPMKKALIAKATGGEIAETLREVWGTYRG